MGAVFIYSLLVAYVRKGDHSKTDSYHWNESTLLFLFSIPYLIDLIVGLVGLYWATLLLEATLSRPREASQHSSLIPPDQLRSEYMNKGSKELISQQE